MKILLMAIVTLLFTSCIGVDFNGTVVNDGEIADNVNLILVDYINNEVVAETKSDFDGKFCFKGIRKGAYMLIAQDPNQFHYFREQLQIIRQNENDSFFETKFDYNNPIYKEFDKIEDKLDSLNNDIKFIYNPQKYEIESDLVMKSRILADKFWFTPLLYPHSDSNAWCDPSKYGTTFHFFEMKNTEQNYQTVDIEM